MGVKQRGYRSRSWWGGVGKGRWRGVKGRGYRSSSWWGRVGSGRGVGVN